MNALGSATSSRSRIIAYWTVTVVLATECFVGGVLGIIRHPPYVAIIGHLGYPTYLMTILSVWYVLAGFALLVPGFPRLKEWAYAGLIFNYTGAVASHSAVGGGRGALVASMIFLGLSLTSWALRPSSRRDFAPSSAIPSRSRTIAYWITTLIIAAEMAVGGLWDVLQISYVRTVMEHLGYPFYFLIIIGFWKILCAAALLAPRFPRLKEWAYAGAVFNFTGAAASHFAVGDGAGQWAGPLVFTAITFASWALRSSSRRDPVGAKTESSGHSVG
jgi:uncharacterized membrane protein YphA (DoxX/SURF4 family)